jgi:hypothetical protein
METLNFILIAVPFAGTSNEPPGIDSSSWYVLAGFIVFLILCYFSITKNKTENF